MSFLLLGSSRCCELMLLPSSGVLSLRVRPFTLLLSRVVRGTSRLRRWVRSRFFQGRDLAASFASFSSIVFFDLRSNFSSSSSFFFELYPEVLCDFDYCVVLAVFS